jgi:hypothetical protein
MLYLYSDCDSLQELSAQYLGHSPCTTGIAKVRFAAQLNGNFLRLQRVGRNDMTVASTSMMSKQ